MCDYRNMHVEPICNLKVCPYTNYTLDINGIRDTQDAQLSLNMLIAKLAYSPPHAISSGAVINALLPAAPRC